eukprot:TRINITY_DN809_c0_g1_i2.p1 TRINITY_DN809_c0_g1~~TRINITY_DN809_c0_g1_i2.p1  ORF type:complete len:1791 (+),score=482.24 TRINITY_DN809_c0_g1_i2:97-5373(+)
MAFTAAETQISEAEAVIEAWKQTLGADYEEPEYDFQEGDGAGGGAGACLEGESDAGSESFQDPKPEEDLMDVDGGEADVCLLAGVPLQRVPARGRGRGRREKQAPARRPGGGRGRGRGSAGVDEDEPPPPRGRGRGRGRPPDPPAVPPTPPASVPAPPQPAKEKVEESDDETESEELAVPQATEEWRAQRPRRAGSPERRASPANGKLYTKRQFVQFFGGYDEWNAAAAAPPISSLPVKSTTPLPRARLVGVAPRAVPVVSAPQTPPQPEERRPSPANGKLYTKSQFILFFGGLQEWDHAAEDKDEKEGKEDKEEAPPPAAAEGPDPALVVPPPTKVRVPARPQPPRYIGERELVETTARTLAVGGDWEQGIVCTCVGGRLGRTWRSAFQRKHGTFTEFLCAHSDVFAVSETDVRLASGVIGHYSAYEDCCPDLNHEARKAAEKLLGTTSERLREKLARGEELGGAGDVCEILKSMLSDGRPRGITALAFAFQFALKPWKELKRQLGTMSEFIRDHTPEHFTEAPGAGEYTLASHWIGCVRPIPGWEDPEATATRHQQLRSGGSNLISAAVSAGPPRDDAQLAELFKQLLWDRRPRLTTALTQALQHIDGKGITWSQNYKRHFGSVEDFLRRHKDFFQEVPPQGAGQLPKFVLHPNAKSFDGSTVQPMPGWENVEEANAKAQQQSLAVKAADASATPALSVMDQRADEIAKDRQGLSLAQAEPLSQEYGGDPKGLLIRRRTFGGMPGMPGENPPFTYEVDNGPDGRLAPCFIVTITLRDGRKAVGVAPKKALAERAACFHACVLTGAKPPREKNEVFVPESTQWLAFNPSTINKAFSALDHFQREAGRYRRWERYHDHFNRQYERAHRGLPMAWDKHFLGSDASRAVLEGREQGRRTVRYMETQPEREGLTAAQSKMSILNALRQYQVVIISGDTGTGKTTQVPQYILDDAIDSGEGAGTRIIVTQPRRIACIAVAERVAQERGEEVGKSVGYAVRLAAQAASSPASITYCTAGVLLRKLRSDPDLEQATHLVLDEVHDRDLSTDILMAFVRELIRRRRDLRVIVQSATLHARNFYDYWSALGARVCYCEIPGQMHPVDEYHLDELLVMLGKKEDDLPEAKRRRLQEVAPHGAPQAPLSPWRAMVEDPLDLELLRDTVLYLCQDDATMNNDQLRTAGAILIFVSGMDDITVIRRMLEDIPGQERRLIVCCHSALILEEQKKLFSPPPTGKRKIIIATNIAETSVTLPDVVYVIDTGHMKEMTYDAERRVTALLKVWQSKANAKQRMGRAGRVRPGVCFRLYSKATYEAFRERPTPEIQRTPLEQTCLVLRATNRVRRCADFLHEVMDHPSSRAVDAAVNECIALGAMKGEEEITPLGYLLARLPVTPRMGRMLIHGVVWGCLPPLLTLAATMQARDPFLMGGGNRVDAQEAKYEVSQGSRSDHLAVAEAYRRWEADPRQGAKLSLGQGICEQIAGIRGLLRKNLHELQFDTDSWDASRSVDQELIRGLVCGALYPNVARAQTFVKNENTGRMDVQFNTLRERAVPHSTSVVSKEKSFPSQWLVYQEKGEWVHQEGRGGICCLRGITMVTAAGLALFGGPLTTTPSRDYLWVGNDISFRTTPDVCDMIARLRGVIDDIMWRHIMRPEESSSEAERKVLNVVLQLLREGHPVDPQVQKREQAQLEREDEVPVAIPIHAVAGVSPAVTAQVLFEQKAAAASAAASGIPSAMPALVGKSAPVARSAPKPSVVPSKLPGKAAR